MVLNVRDTGAIQWPQPGAMATCSALQPLRRGIRHGHQPADHRQAQSEGMGKRPPSVNTPGSCTYSVSIPADVANRRQNCLRRRSMHRDAAGITPSTCCSSSELVRHAALPSSRTGRRRRPADRPDLVLIDLQLPDFDGFRCCRRRTGRRRPSPPASPCRATPIPRTWAGSPPAAVLDKPSLGAFLGAFQLAGQRIGRRRPAIEQAALLEHRHAAAARSAARRRPARSGMALPASAKASSAVGVSASAR